MELPLVSIIVSTYNGGQFIRAQIESLLQQTYRNIEIIVSDDASTDDTRSILLRFTSIPTVNLVFNDLNVGFIRNFERGILLAKGAYIALCDQDDIWLPEKIDLFCRYIGNYSLIYSDSRLIDEQGQDLGKKVSDIKRMYTGSDTKGFVTTNIVSGHAMMFKREVLSHAMPLRTDVYHDEWLAINATVLHGIIYVDQALTLYRQHTKNVTRIVMGKRTMSRPLNDRYNALQKKLHWIQILGSIQKKKDKQFYTELYRLFELKKNKKFVWPLFFFLIRHRRALFRHTRKNFASQLVEIRKLARGEQYKAV